MATTGKIAQVIFEEAVKTHEHQMQMLDLTTLYKPNSGDMQNAGNFVWRTVQQHAPVQDGWDMTGNYTDIIEETYPAILGTPKNDVFEQRADDLRDMQFWERRGQESGKKLATDLNKGISTMVGNTGGLFFSSAATSGYDFIAEGQAILNERQAPSDDMRYFMLNDRDNLKFGKDLAARQTLQGRPEDTWKTGQIGQNVANFDVYTGSFLPNLAGNAGADSTTTAALSGKPEGGSVNATTGVVTNVDYRTFSFDVVAGAGYAVGDVIKFDNAGTDVESLALSDKSATGQPMTFKIVGVATNTLTIYPKPIALDDAALSTLEKAYANINTQITSGANVVKLNTWSGSKKANQFWCKDSIEVTGGDAPVELLSSFGGMRVISDTMSNGQRLYMAYDGNIDTLSFKCRLFTWYGITNKNPSLNGNGYTS